jgi:hypothetical protein
MGIRRTFVGLLGVVFVLASSVVSQAATPASGTLSFSNPSLSWTNTAPLTGTAVARRQITCNLNPGACDNYSLTINTVKHGSIDPNALVDIKLVPSAGAQMEIVLYPPGCNPALTTNSPCYSAQGTEAKMLNPANGQWTVQVACSVCSGASYQARATVADFSYTLPPAGYQKYNWVSAQMPNFPDGTTPTYGEPGIWINANGRAIVNTFGPTVWVSHDTGQSFGSALNLFNQDTLCATYSGDGDAVVAYDNTFYADNLCVGSAGASNDSFTNIKDGDPSQWTGPYNAGSNVDRQWYVPDTVTPGVVYMGFHDLQGPNINMLKSIDYGHTFVCPITGLVATTCPVTQTLNGNNPNSGYLDTAVGNVTGRPVIDPTNHSQIYLPYADNSALASATAPPTNQDFDLTRVRVAVSSNGGQSWSADTNPTGGPVLDANKTFPYDGVQPLPALLLAARQRRHGGDHHLHRHADPPVPDVIHE